MTQEYRDEVIAFRYPDNWNLEREEYESGWTLTLQSPGTAFLTLTCDENMPTIEEVAETTLEALKEDYPQLEAEVAVETIAGQMALGHDIQFFSLDLTATCHTRSFYGAGGTLLLMCQMVDVEEELYEPVIKAVCKSMEVVEE